MIEEIVVKNVTVYDKKSEKEEENNYRICQQYRVSIEELLSNYSEYDVEIDEMAQTPEFTLKASEAQRIWQGFKQFYKKEDIFYTDDFDYVVISFYSNVQDIEIAGKNLMLRKPL